MESHTSESNLVIISRKNKFLRFVNIYSNTLIIFLTPILLIPIITLGDNNAYVSFYVFLVTASYWITNVLHPSVTSLIALAFINIMALFDIKLISNIHIDNSVLDCFGIMVVITAVEQSRIHKRVAIKILLLCGCSHFRLSFILFFTTMLLSMWLTSAIACGLMVPLVKGILKELEKMGILETREITVQSCEDDEMVQKPTDFTVFYFLGIAYSSTIEIVASLLFDKRRTFILRLFPQSPSVEIPQYLLLTLPGILVMEMCLYLWLNFYFLGILRVQNYTALQASLTGDEEQYISILLKRRYRQMGRIKYEEMIVGSVIILTAILQTVVSTTCLRNSTDLSLIGTSAPTIISSLILFLVPIKFNCLNVFSIGKEPLPTSRSRGLLTWSTVRMSIHWSVLFVMVCSNVTFETLKHSKMTDEFEKFLFLFANLPRPLLVFAVTILCKVLTEFASNETVLKCLLRHIAKLSISSKINPLYLMASATLSISLPFHVITGAAVNALVLSHINIPHHKMLLAGIGPSVVGILTNLFTIYIWSKAVWPDIDLYPDWASEINLEI